MRGLLIAVRASRVHRRIEPRPTAKATPSFYIAILLIRLAEIHDVGRQLCPFPDTASLVLSRKRTDSPRGGIGPYRRWSWHSAFQSICSRILPIGPPRKNSPFQTPCGSLPLSLSRQSKTPSRNVSKPSAIRAGFVPRDANYRLRRIAYDSILPVSRVLARLP